MIAKQRKIIGGNDVLSTFNRSEEVYLRHSILQTLISVLLAEQFIKRRVWIVI